MESSRTNSISSPITEIQIECTDDSDFKDDYDDDDDLFNPSRDNSFTLYPEPESSRASSNLSIRTQIPRAGSISPRIAARISSEIELNADTSIEPAESIKYENYDNESLGNHSNRETRETSSNLAKNRKVSSDNSLKSPFQVIPALLKSFSSVGSQLFGKSTSNNHQFEKKYYQTHCINNSSTNNNNYLDHNKTQKAPNIQYLLPTASINGDGGITNARGAAEYTMRVSKSCQTIITAENSESTLRKSSTVEQLTESTWNRQQQHLNSSPNNVINLKKDHSLVPIEQHAANDHVIDQLDEDVPLFFSLNKKFNY